MSLIIAVAPHNVNAQLALRQDMPVFDISLQEKLIEKCLTPL